MAIAPAISPAIVILNQQSLPVARQIQTALVGALIYGLESRVAAAEVDVSFTNFGDSLRALFADGRPIIGICAAGILIRTLASQISDKRQEPPVLAVAEDGSAVVPLLGGLQGVNELARQMGTALNVSPAITTAGDLRFRADLLAPPPGYTLANPEDAKTFISDLLAGASVKLEGQATWLSESQLPFSTDAALTIRVTEYISDCSEACLVYHPKTIAIGVDSRALLRPDLSCCHSAKPDPLPSSRPAAVAGIFAPLEQAANADIQAVGSWRSKLSSPVSASWPLLSYWR